MVQPEYKEQLALIVQGDPAQQLLSALHPRMAQSTGLLVCQPTRRRSSPEQRALQWQIGQARACTPGSCQAVCRELFCSARQTAGLLRLCCSPVSAPALDAGRMLGFQSLPAAVGRPGVSQQVSASTSVGASSGRGHTFGDSAHISSLHAKSPSISGWLKWPPRDPFYPPSRRSACVL